MVLALLFSVVTPIAASAATQVSEPVYDFAGAIRETVWVNTGLDGDADGQPDRVAADIVRPKEPAAQGIKIPVIMDASPYYACCGRGNESELKTYDSAGRPVGFPLFYDNYFVPRGYAIVLVDLAGTNRSQGCADVGGPSDVTSAKAVVDWLNGRAQGYTAKTGGSATTAGWSTGKVGMIGKSYDATIANGVAATGVDGLKTIVPIAGISSWYNYYRSDGATFGFNPVGLAQTVERGNSGQNCSAANQKLTQGATSNGDYGPFWSARDYLSTPGSVRASVLLSHGLGDLNVQTIHFGQWWDRLAANGVERKIWLSQTGHVDPFDYRRAQWVDTLHKWFDHYLLGIDNGIERGPMASIERAPDQWVDQSSWPAANTAGVTYRPHAGTSAGLGSLTTAPSSGAAAFTDSPRLSETDWAAQPSSVSANRLLYSTGKLDRDLQISGTSTITVTATPNTSTAQLSAVLVDYGPATIRNYTGSGEGIKTGTGETCWGANAPGDNGCYRVTTTDSVNVGSEIFSRGWADLGNYRSLSKEEPLTPGKPYTMTFRLASTDHVVPKGHQLALIIGGTDAGFLGQPRATTKFSVDLAKTSLNLPVVGAAPTFGLDVSVDLPLGLGHLRLNPEIRLG